MTTETIALTAGLIFIFLAILGGGITAKDTNIPVLGRTARSALGLLGFLLCLPFILSYLPTDQGVPRGTIVAWNSKTGPVPRGWAICNGTYGTPNLEDRFLMGVTIPDKIGLTGGRADIPMDGEHSHGGATNETIGVMHGLIFYDRQRQRDDDYQPKFRITPDGKHNHGGENRPPYYSVVYIIKL